MPYKDPERGRAYLANWYQRNKERRKQQVKEWIRDNPDRRRIYANRYYHSSKGQTKYKARRAALWEEFIAAYGGKCECCNESNRGFLSIEHIGGGGKKHRVVHGNTILMLADIKKRGYPKGQFTVLCFNCNLGTARLGICPHKT